MYCTSTLLTSPACCLFALVGSGVLRYACPTYTNWTFLWESNVRGEVIFLKVVHRLSVN